MEVCCLPADADHRRLTDAPKELARRLMAAPGSALLVLIAILQACAAHGGAALGPGVGH